MQKNARQAAYEILLRMEKDGAYSNLILDETLEKSDLDSRDKSFVSALVYGTTERKLTVDYELSLYLSSPLKKLKKQVLTILRMGAYQIFFMSKVPNSAAVNESVKLSKKNQSAYASSLINAVLRKCSQNGLVYPKKDTDEFLSVYYSCPLWLIHKWNKQYGKSECLHLLEESLKKAETVIRVNTLKTDEKTLAQLLLQEGVESEKTVIENSLKIFLSGKEITKLNSFKQGLFHVQDIASTLCAQALCAKSNETVFDLCAAPGGKSFSVAQLMNNSGKIFAFDLYPQRTKLISQGAKRLGIDIITAAVGDASEHNAELGLADRVLCDVPCSGLGIIRRKPEIRYKDESEVDALPPLQLKILENAARYVKPGGRLVYSTCTLNKNENENVCLKFLENSSDFESVEPLSQIGKNKFLTLMPHINQSDGFFIAAFKRKG